MLRKLKKFFQLTIWLIAALFTIGLFIGDNDNESLAANKLKPITLASDVSSNPKEITKPDIKVVPNKTISHLPKVEMIPQEHDEKSAPQSIIKSVKLVKTSAPNSKVETAALGYKYISKNSVNVRALPTIKSPKIGNLKLNTQINYYQYNAGWYQIKIPDSQIMGWIRADLLADAKRQSKPKPKAPLALKSVKKTGPTRSPYYGTCDCPYDRARNGSRCGGRSAYSRPGGRSPVCYW